MGNPWGEIDLTPFLDCMGVSDAGAVSDVRELSGGASKDIWYFTVRMPAGDDRPFILRRSVRELRDGALGIGGEYAVMRAAFDAGVRAPEPYYEGTDGKDQPFMIMAFLAGETLAPRLFRREEYAGAQQRMAAQFGEFLAPVHRVAPSESLHAVLGPLPGEHPGRLALTLYRALYDTMKRNPHPVFDLAFRHLEQTLPEAYDITLVHGDYRLGNVIFGPEGLRAVLDWELAHWGDPMEDLAWVCTRAWRFGHDDKPVAGCGTREEYWAAYEAAGGQAVDPARAHWWEIFCNLKWGVITLMQSVGYIDRTTDELEKGAIGRRAAEVEGEMLNLIRE